MRRYQLGNQMLLGYFVWLVLGVICGYIAGEVAVSKKWAGIKWMILGFLFGPLGVIGAAGLPDRELRKNMRLLAEAQGVEVTSPEPDTPLQS